MRELCHDNQSHLYRHDPIGRQYEDRAEGRTYIDADRDSGRAIIVDSVIESVERDLTIIKELGLTLNFALETHIHADHITGASRIKDRTGANIVYGGAIEGVVTGVDRFLHEGQELAFGNTTIRALPANLKAGRIGGEIRLNAKRYSPFVPPDSYEKTFDVL